MIRALTLLVIAAACSFGQVAQLRSSSGTSYVYKNKATGAEYPAYWPSPLPIYVDGTGPCTISSATASPTGGIYDSISLNILNATTPAVGNAPNVRLRWDADFNNLYQSSGIAVGNTYSKTITLNLTGTGCPATLTYTANMEVRQMPPYPKVTGPLYPGICVKRTISGTAYTWSEEKCNPTDEIPFGPGGPSPSADIPASYNPFGFFAKKISTIGKRNWYPNSSNATIEPEFWLRNSPGGTNIERWNVATNTKTAGPFAGGNMAYVFMPSTIDRDVFWRTSTDGTTLQEIRVTGDGTTSSVTPIFSTTDIGSTGQITNYGEYPMTPDGWMAFVTNTAGSNAQIGAGGWVCALNTNGLTNSNYMSKLYCQQWSTFAKGTNNISNLGLWSQSWLTGTRWLAMQKACTSDLCANWYFTVDTNTPLSSGLGGIVYSHEAGEWTNTDGNSTTAGNGNGQWDTGEAGVDMSHSGIALGGDGNPYLCSDKDGPNSRWIVCHDISKAANLSSVPVSQGGAMLLIGDANDVDHHFDCKDAPRGQSVGPVCMIDVGASGYAYTPLMITAATAANPPVVTTAAHGITVDTTAQVYVGSHTTAGWPCLHEKSVVAAYAVTSTTLRLDGLDCTGSPALTTGANALVTSSPTRTGGSGTRLGSFDNSAVMMIGDALVPIIRNRNTNYTANPGLDTRLGGGDPTEYGGYWNYSFAVVSLPASGQYPKWAMTYTNGGYPYSGQSYAINIEGVKPPPLTVTAIPGGFIANSACKLSPSKLVYTTNANYITSQQTDNMEGAFNKVVTGKTGGVPLYGWHVCGGGATKFTVTPLAAASGTKAVSVSAKGIPGAANIVAGWASTSTGTYTEGSSASCSSGSTCTASVTADQGQVWVRYRITNGGGSTIASKVVPIANY